MDPVGPETTAPDEAAVPGDATAPAEPATDVSAVSDVPPASAAVAKPSSQRRAAIRRGLFRLASFALLSALFIGGIAGGVAVFHRLQPPPPVVGDVTTNGVGTPTAVQELVSALESNDSDSLRAAVDADPYRLLAGEMQRWDVKTVSSVETLATMADGPRSATEIVIEGRSSDESPLLFNLIVHVENGVITEFR